MSDTASDRPSGGQIASGASWSGVAKVTIQLSQIAAATVVARRVAPSAFGLVGMAILVMGFVGLFRELGLGAAVIQHRTLTDRQMSSVYWVNVIFGTAITAICILSAPLAGMFFREPGMVVVLRAMALTMFISSLSSTQICLLTRKMAFRKIALIEIAGSLSRIATVVTLACMGAGVWSLVISSLADSVVTSVLFYSLGEWHPSLAFSRSELRPLLDFGMKVAGFNFFNYFARNADNAIIGRYLGSGALGFYELAYSIMFFPVQSIAWLLMRVLFPAFSKLQDDDNEFRRVYLQACSAIALITFPLMTGIMLLADPLIRTVYGPKWVSVIPVLVILAPVGMVQSVFSPSGQIALGKGRPGLFLRVGTFAGCAYIVSFFAGLPWGIKGVACAYAICNVVLSPLFLIYFRLIKLRFTAFLRALRPIILATTMMAGVIYGLRSAVLSRVAVAPVIDLLAWTSIGAAVYIAGIYVLNPPIAQIVVERVPILRNLWNYGRRSTDTLTRATYSSGQ